MNPTSAVKSEAVTTVDLHSIAPGTVHTVAWRGQPIFLFHRTADEVTAMEKSYGVKTRSLIRRGLRSPTGWW